MNQANKLAFLSVLRRLEFINWGLIFVIKMRYIFLFASVMLLLLTQTTTAQGCSALGQQCGQSPSGVYWGCCSPNTCSQAGTCVAPCGSTNATCTSNSGCCSGNCSPISNKCVNCPVGQGKCLMSNVCCPRNQFCFANPTTGTTQCAVACPVAQCPRPV